MSKLLLGDNKMPINEFLLDSMVINPTIAMIAKRGSGKSYICRAILYHNSKIPVGMIIAPTDKMSCFYGNFFPDTFIHYEYNKNLVEEVLARQQIMIEKMKIKKKQNKKIDPRCMLVMDDCLSSKGEWAKEQTIAELFFNGRHYHITYILTMQFPLGMTPEFRSNFDYVFLLADDVISNLKRLYDHYAGMFPSFGLFKQVFAQITKDYGSLVINNRGSREDLYQKIFWYKAPDLSNNPSPVIGCKQFNKFHDLNYNKSWRNNNKQKPFNDYSRPLKDAVQIEQIKHLTSHSYKE